MTASQEQELKEKLVKLEQENVELKEEIAYLKFELEELRSKRYKGKKKRPGPGSEDGQEKREVKKRGGIFGHVGWFRKKPEKIDRIEEVHLRCCPECGSKDIRECKNRIIDEHIQEDIVLPKVETVLYRHYEYYCKDCKKVVSGQGREEMENSYIGPKAKALAVFMRYGVKISERDVRNLFEKAFQLKIVASSIAGFREQLKEAGAPLYERLVKSLKKGSFIHGDETGWKVNGENRWLWKFSNKKVCVSHIDESRGQNVVEALLGESYEGVLISDFLSAYNKITTRGKQRCLAHILRDIEKVKEYWHEDQEVLRYASRLEKIFQDAVALYGEYRDKPWDKTYRAQRKSLAQALEDFEFPNPNKRILKRFAKRLMRHKGELLTFLYQKDVDYHNNHAEQQIRPDVIFRKVTFGNRSEVGVQCHNVIMSILQTAKLNGMDAIKTFEHILLRAKRYPFLQVLAPP